MRTILIPVLAIVLAGCRYNDLGCTRNSNLFETDVTLTLAYGETVCHPGTGLALRFERVLSDSRCPEDVNCIQAGEIRILLTILEDAAAHDVIGFGSAGPPVEVSVAGKDFVLTFLDASPKPNTHRRIRMHDYSLDLRIQPKTE